MGICLCEQNEIGFHTWLQESDTLVMSGPLGQQDGVLVLLMLFVSLTFEPSQARRDPTSCHQCGPRTHRAIVGVRGEAGGLDGGLKKSMTLAEMQW